MLTKGYELTSLPKICRRSIRLTPDHFSVGTLNVYGAGVVKTNKSAGRLVLDQALHLEAHIAAVGVGADEVGALEDDGVKLDGVGRLGN